MQNARCLRTKEVMKSIGKLHPPFMALDFSSEVREIITQSLRKFTIDTHVAREFSRESIRCKNLHGRIAHEYSFMQQ